MGLRYAPESLALTPLDRGFTVERRYEAVDAPADVVREADGGWRIKAGARVRVRLTMVAEARRYHVALVDPLPAGLEPLNPALAVDRRAAAGARRSTPSEAGAPGSAAPADRARGGGGAACGTSTRTCATTAPRRSRRCSGRGSTPTPTWRAPRRRDVFVVPPPRAEEMYAPETFGRGATDTVTMGGRDGFCNRNRSALNHA